MYPVRLASLARPPGDRGWLLSKAPSCDAVRCCFLACHAIMSPMRWWFSAEDLEMKTNANAPAMIAIAQRITEVLAITTELAAEAGGCTHPGEMDQLVGTLLRVEADARAVLELIAAVKVLQSLPVAP